MSWFIWLGYKTIYKKQQMKQQDAELIADTELPTTISIKAVQLFPLSELIT